LEREVEARETELNSWRERYQAVKKNYDEQLCTCHPSPHLIILAEADKLRDMILTKEGENNQLKEKITSLQEDIDTVRTPPTKSCVLKRTPFLFTDLPVRSRLLAVCWRASKSS
jgi:chromosome segregation ATPase